MQFVTTRVLVGALLLAPAACSGPVTPSTDAPVTTDTVTPADRSLDDSAVTPDDVPATMDATTDVAPGMDATMGTDATVGIDAAMDARADTGTDARADVRTDARTDARTDSGTGGSAGCGRAATSGVTHPTLRVGTLDRTYVLSIPAGYDRNRPYPLVFGWHGRRGSGTGFRGGGTSYGGGVERAAAGAAIFVYPDGLPVTSDTGDTGWVDVDFDSRDFALFDALLARMSADFCVDRSRVFSYGHSFGAYMSQGLGCRRPTVVRGIGAVAGGPPYQSSTCPGGAVAAWIDNAQNDMTVDFDTRGIPARNYWIRANGCGSMTMPVAPTPCVAYQGCSEPLHWCAPTTGDHGWPSFANDGIWNFFEAL